MKTSISEKAKIGVMTVGHKEYWEWNQFPAMKGDLTRMGQDIADCIRETGAEVYILDMAMHGEGYFSAMYHNISTLKGALE